MEHEEEKIRKKIQQAETIRVAWNKELVWQAIGKQPAAQPRPLFIYYAAASVLLAIALIIYSFERTQQQQLEVQLAQLELAILKESKQPLIVYNDQQSAHQSENCKPETAVVKVPRREKEQKQQPAKNSNLQETVLLATIEPEQAVMVEPVQVKQSTTESQSTPTVQRVTAIIGSENNKLFIPSSADKRLALKIQYIDSEPETSERKMRSGEFMLKY
jgi:hypothetical protein